MAEAARVDLIQRPFPRVAEGRVPEVVPEGDGLGESSFSLRAREMVRAICETSSVWVSRVR